jgi:hypothetical protein
VPPPSQRRLAGYSAEAEELLVTAMEQITAATPTASAVKSKMVTLDPTFDPVNYDGCRSVRDVLGKLGYRVRTVGRSGHDITLALIDPPDGPGVVLQQPRHRATQADDQMTCGRWRRKPPGCDGTRRR